MSGETVAARDAVPIGRLIRSARQRRGLTQYQLADELVLVSGNESLGRGEVSRWERGKRVPGPYWQQHLSRVLGVPPDELRAAARATKEWRQHQ
ncbi:helix-turn-helix domain-containing protein [Amycolatopsis viridis]|uniref:Transcriptional regulator with XRE-family HTH domain n=1 Tax=Amycolatopsis viridis TaxID=185678 RepID=A0ABX0T2E8_9PSEU|nr:helix-turn-helix transcriptional regulator [Amycolatopsis viridis]NIH82948.1 transcriptional regulator with XRE-family HTH domain [Amycolatopsis viridis]